MLDGIAARKDRDSGAWRLGDLALEVETAYGDHTLEKYADDIGVSYQQLLNYQAVAKAYETTVRTVNLTWTHHERIASRDDRLDWLAQAENHRWSIKRLYRISTDRRI